MATHPFDVDTFLRQPLTARIATNGPTVRPVWFLWEDGAFWILTGPWARLFDRVRVDPAVALVVDECDLATGLVRQVIARGRAELVSFDVERGRRKLVRCLGADEALWDERFVRYLHDDPARHGVATAGARFADGRGPEFRHWECRNSVRISLKRSGFSMFG